MTKISTDRDMTRERLELGKLGKQRQCCTLERSILKETAQCQADMRLQFIWMLDEAGTVEFNVV